MESGQDFTYLGNIQTSNNNFSAEYIRRIGLAAGVMNCLERVWSQTNLRTSTKIRYIRLACWRYSSTARKLGPLRNWTGGDWSRSTWGASGGSSTSDGTTTYPTTKFSVALVCWQLLPSFANDVSDCCDALRLAEDRSFWRQIARTGSYGWTLRVTMTQTTMS